MVETSMASLLLIGIIALVLITVVVGAVAFFAFGRDQK